MNEKLLEQKAEEYASDIKGIDMTCTLLSAKDKQHAYILGRYEGYIAGATEETKLLSKHILELQNDKGKLIDENKEARRLIKNLLKHTYGQNLNTQSDFDLYLGLIKDAEKFLGE